MCSWIEAADVGAAMDLAYNQGGPNPDYMYGWTEVDPEASTASPDFAVPTASPSFRRRTIACSHAGEPRNSNPITNDLDQLTLGPDGYFSVIISAERPAGYGGDWWTLRSDTVAIICAAARPMRQRGLNSRIATVSERSVHQSPP